MDQSKPSRTSDIPAVMRALHQTRDGEPKILADSVAAKLIDLNTLDPNWIGTILSHPFAPQWRAGFAIRSRYTEDCLAEAVAAGVRQYLILGAGLDTFCYRQPAWAEAIDIFEVDHPATQTFKLTQLAKIGIALPPNLTFTPIDFETTQLGEALRATKFEFDKKTFCSWLGVAQYLTGEAIEATLNFVLSLPAGSEIVLSFVLPQAALSGLEADAMMTAAARSAEAGEPWISRFHPGEIELLLRRGGFSKVIHLSPEEAHERYLRHRTDGLTGRRGEQLIRAIV